MFFVTYLLLPGFCAAAHVLRVADILGNHCPPSGYWMGLPPMPAGLGAPTEGASCSACVCRGRLVHVPRFTILCLWHPPVSPIVGLVVLHAGCSLLPRSFPACHPSFQNTPSACPPPPPYPLPPLHPYPTSHLANPSLHHLPVLFTLFPAPLSVLPLPLLSPSLPPPLS